MRKFKDEFSVPLEKVHRGWIRIPVVLFLSPILLTAVILFSLVEAFGFWWKEWIVVLIKGDKL